MNTWLVAIAIVALCACDGSSPGSVDAGVDTGIDATEVGKADEGEVALEVDAWPVEEADTLEPADAALDGVGPDVVQGLEQCQGQAVALGLVNQLPYAEVEVGGARGWFLVDWGTTGSAIDPRGFLPFAPQPVFGTQDRWDGFSFFGPWGTVTLSPQDFSGFGDDFAQAGILGTDFLALNTFVVDWGARTLARADVGAGCSDATLRAAGFAPLSTEGYFASDWRLVDPGVPNIPTIPVRIGDSVAPAQIDTGYDDTLVGTAININVAYFEEIQGALVRAPELDLVLTTCVPGLVELVDAYRLKVGETLGLVGEDGADVQREADAIVFVKDTPSSARHCGGIGTWSVPAGQLAVSFVARAGRAVFAPGQSRVWLPRID